MARTARTLSASFSRAYPGKLTEMDTFRIGNIGEIYPEDIDKLTGIIAAFLKERKEQIG